MIDRRVSHLQSDLFDGAFSAFQQESRFGNADAKQIIVGREYGIVAQDSLPSLSGTRSQSYLTDMGLTGYVGDRIDGNIANWQVRALESNPYIIGAIEDGVQAKKDSNMFWRREFPGKMLTGMVFSYRLSPSESLKAAIEKLVDELIAVQGSDGYLGTYTDNARFTTGWDLWNHYHIIT